jgi:hypothetical protein
MVPEQTLPSRVQPVLWTRRAMSADVHSFTMTTMRSIAT